MADTTFVSKVTQIATGWLQDINNFFYRHTGFTSKATPVDADTWYLWDSVASTWKTLSLANLKTVLAAACSAGWNALTSSSCTGNSATSTLAATATTATTANDLSGTPTFFAPITNSLSGDVSISDSTNYFTGPSVAQGSTGKWFASGTVTLYGVNVLGVFYIKLWDGTTVIASATYYQSTLNYPHPVSISGFISSPAGNIRISVRNTAGGTSEIGYNNSGLGKDSTLTAIRVG